MNPNKGRVLISLGLMVSGMVGVAVALSQSPRGMSLFQSPPLSIQPAATKPVAQPVQKAAQVNRSQEIATQLDQSMAGQFLKQLSGQADTKVEESKSAIGNFIKQKTNEQGEHLKQIVVEALQETVSGEVKKQTESLKTEFKGIKLTAEQSAQIQQARREMQAELLKEIQSNPDLLKQVQAGKPDQNLSQPLKNYSDIVAGVLTPEQRTRWEKNFSFLKKSN